MPVLEFGAGAKLTIGASAAVSYPDGSSVPATVSNVSPSIENPTADFGSIDNNVFTAGAGGSGEIVVSGTVNFTDPVDGPQAVAATGRVSVTIHNAVSSSPTVSLMVELMPVVG